VLTPEKFVELVKSIGVPFIQDITSDYNGPWQATGNLDGRASIYMDEGMALAQWAEGLKVLEIGTGLGVSTVSMAFSAKSVVTIDPNEHVRSRLTLPSNVTQLASFSQVQGAFDFAFIDGMHDFSSVMTDILDCLSVIGPGGFLSFHDMAHVPVRRAVDMFAWSSRIELVTPGQLTLCGVPA
jgi:predicted O-methyltransferase YrrM